MKPDYPFAFPATTFVETNSIPKQVCHVATEVWEVVKAAVRRDWHHCAVECCDVIHSTETLLRIIVNKFGVNLEQIRRETEMKNRRRGYYGKD